MPSIRYKGPHSAVEVPSLGNRICAYGEDIELTDEVAAGFLDQADWELVQPAKTKQASPSDPAPNTAEGK